MHLLNYNIISSHLLSAGFMMLSASALALSSDNQQPIYIDSAKQAIDMQTNTVTLTGNVVVKRGSINLCADRVVITRFAGKDDKEVAEGYGNPVTFSQLQDDGKPIHGCAQKVRYETKNNLLILTGNAYLEQLNTNVNADCIIYFVNKKQMEAFSNKGNQVTTVLLPAEFPDKENKNKDLNS
ncbi:lipopolysaccharide ABC transporter substrate-binding protein LptA [Candidatus Steffania adelgidicola]|uniref:lipopolysaccharide ABC transporter substrate-binding protein LptA n=1 Tax=Candidatus Steffania adelgidicola TaxID=1076626 RepID=UPI001D00B865|nr:lipopolysaccharide ABC transporter substrate-binding protein LptA [Candidatus Steffania adelgidicola]UDG80192.1 Lipopolysaccharide export system protein LptA [Candidatus Steffania adelgidicola]